MQEIDAQMLEDIKKGESNEEQQDENKKGQGVKE